MTRRALLKRIQSARDVLLIRFGWGGVLVVSCDSTGAVGRKTRDQIKVDPSVVGRFTARVALMEAISVGAVPLCLSVTLTVEPEPSGREIMKGIRRELRNCEVNEPMIVQSSEKNFMAHQTGVGVTVNALVEESRLRLGKGRVGDIVAAIGTPCVGYQVLKGERTGTIADLKDLNALPSLGFVHDIIPVGSKGALKEARILAADSRLQFRPRRNVAIGMDKSAGPATLLLCSLPKFKWSELRQTIDKPLSIIGELQ
jgi:hypothetical protein